MHQASSKTDGKKSFGLIRLGGLAILLGLAIHIVLNVMLRLPVSQLGQYEVAWISFKFLEKDFQNYMGVFPRALESSHSHFERFSAWIWPAQGTLCVTTPSVVKPRQAGDKPTKAACIVVEVCENVIQSEFL